MATDSFWGQAFIAYAKDNSVAVCDAFRLDFESADRFLLVVNFILWLLVSTVGGLHYGMFMLGIIGGGLTFGLAVLAYGLARGTLACRMTLAANLSVFAAILITQQHGLIEAHFIYFVSVALVLVYKDLIPLLTGAVIIAVHHLGAAYCQANEISIGGVPIMAFNWGIVEPLIWHVAAVVFSICAGYVIVANSAKQFRDQQLMQSRLLEVAARNGEVMSAIQQAAESLHGNSSEISSDNSDLRRRTEDQGLAIQQLASSTEQLTVTVRQSTGHAGEANQLATVASQQAEKGNAVVKSTIDAMNAISASSRQIADIIGVIDEIAFQTNLLALNAAVEAARAGEQGRGFAVVAGEVRKLAGRSADAAKEIKRLIQDSVAKVGDGARLVDASGITLSEIAEGIGRVKTIVARIAQASQEQSAGIDQINRAINQIDANTRENTTLVGRTAEASQAMTDIVEQLQVLSGDLQVA